MKPVGLLAIVVVTAGLVAGDGRTRSTQGTRSEMLTSGTKMVTSETGQTVEGECFPSQY